jgi:hypothetical protein
VVLDFELRSFSLEGKHCTIEPCLQTFLAFIYFLAMIPCYCLGWLGQCSFYLHLPSYRHVPPCLALKFLHIFEEF